MTMKELSTGTVRIQDVLDQCKLTQDIENKDTEVTGELKRFTITEWDDTENKVIAFKENGNVIMMYDDGVTHTVSEEYFKSILEKTFEKRGIK
jgi:hypothetical protein